MKRKMKKKQPFKLVLLLWIVFVSAPLVAQIQKEKIIQESFPIQNGSTLYINNQFGKIHINTANVASIQVKVSITAEANSAAMAESILNSISIKMEKGKNIKLETQKQAVSRVLIPSFVQGNQKAYTNNKNTEFQVNYTITMPANMPLELVNKYGSIYLDNHQAPLKIDLKYGDMKAQQLGGAGQKVIHLKFSAANIDYLENAELDFGFSTLNLQKAKNLQFVGKHGTHSIGEVQRISGSSSFSNFEITTLTQALQMETKHDGKFAIARVSTGFENLDLTADFSGVEIGFDPQASFDFVIDVKFASLKADKSNYVIHSQQETDKSAHYEGQKGGSNKGKVIIKSQFGDVKFK